MRGLLKEYVTELLPRDNPQVLETNKHLYPKIRATSAPTTNTLTSLLVTETTRIHKLYKKKQPQVTRRVYPLRNLRMRYHLKG